MAEALEWTTFDASNAIPAGVEELLTSIQGALSAVETALEAVKAMFEVVKLFVTNGLDILAAVLEAIRESIATLIESLEEAGVYSCIYVPGTLGAAVRPSVWMTRLCASMKDLGDENRPEFTTSQGMAGLVLMVTTTNWANLMSGMSALIGGLVKPMKIRGELFLDADELAATWGENLRSGTGKAPDWEVTTLIELLPPLAALSNVLKKLLGVLNIGAGLSDLLQQFIDFLQSKLDLIGALVDELQAVIAILQSLLALPAAHVLVFAGNWTTDELTAELLGAGLPQLLLDEMAEIDASLAELEAGDPATLTTEARDAQAAAAESLGIPLSDLSAAVPTSGSVTSGASESLYKAAGLMLLAAGAPITTVNLMIALFSGTVVSEASMA